MKVCLTKLQCIYVKFIHPANRGTKKEYGDQPLFLTATGEQLSHSTMVITLMKQVGHDITFTKNRRQVLTSRKDAGAAEQELEHLAEHMTHSRHTQNLYYDCSDKIDSSIEVLKQLQQGRNNLTSTIVQPSPPYNDDQQSQSVTEPSPLMSQEGAAVQTLSTDDQRNELSSTADISSSTASVVRPKSLNVFSSSSIHSRRAARLHR